MSAVIPPPRAVLFDLDGTLSNSMPSIAAALIDTLQDHGWTATTEAVIAATGPSMPLMIQSLTGVSSERAEQIYDDYLERYYDTFIYRATAIEGAQALLDSLSERDLSLAIVTSKKADGARALLEHLGWAAHFDVVVGRETAAALKPAPEPALFALDALGIDASDAAFVGDTPEDMQCARAARIGTIIGFTMIRAAAELRAAGATHAVATLDELRAMLTVPAGTLTS